MKLFQRGWKNSVVSFLAGILVMLTLGILRSHYNQTPECFMSAAGYDKDYRLIRAESPLLTDAQRDTSQNSSGENAGSLRSGTWNWEKMVNRTHPNDGTFSLPSGSANNETKDMSKYVTRTEQAARQDPISFEACRSAHFLPRGSRPVLALASVPGSGNTWVRYLLERASGIYTGSVYKDKGLYEGGFKGEFAAPYLRNTLIIKTHDTGTSPSTQHYEGGVVIVRNPYDTLLAYANLVKGGHTGRASVQFFQSSEWDAFVESASISWEDRITSWVTRKNVIVVFFEHLKADLRNQIVRLLNYLKVPVDMVRLDCTVAYPEGSFHRKANKTADVINDPYAERHKRIIEGHIRNASAVLRESGHIQNDLSYSGVSKHKGS